MFASCSSTIAVKINGGRTPVIHFRNNHTTATSYKHQIMRDQVCKTAEALAKAKLARTLRFALAADPISAMMRTSRSLPVTTPLGKVRGATPVFLKVVCGKTLNEAASSVLKPLWLCCFLMSNLVECWHQAPPNTQSQTPLRTHLHTSPSQTFLSLST